MSTPTSSPEPSSSEASRLSPTHTVAIEAYCFLYPLVLMELTRRQMTNIAAPHPSGRGPMSTFAHARAYPTAAFRDVVRPNFDTLYSIAWLDLTTEPAVVTVPATPDRYLILPMMDMWTDVFAAPGTRTTGDAGGTFAVVPPGWAGTLPAETARIDAPTPYVWIIGRIQTNGPGDYGAVHALQEQLVTRPLSEWGNPEWRPATEPDPTLDTSTPPLRKVNALSAEALFQMGADLLSLHPPHLSDWSIMARMATIGIVPGEPFDPTALDAGTRAALDTVPRLARRIMTSRGVAGTTVVNGWRLGLTTMGVYGNEYAKRAFIAMIGLGALPPEDAIYPQLLTDRNGDSLDGAHDYVLHFDGDALPPADAFWSLTMYDAEGFQAANPLDRFAIGDRDPLRYGPGGSLDIWIQRESPGPDRESNWLPAPSGPISLNLRLYAARPEALSGEWVPPPVDRVR